MFEKNSGIEKNLAIREGREPRFSVKLFCLTVPKHFVEEFFCVSKNFWYRKKLWIGGREGGREGGKKEGREGGIITFFCQNILSHSA